MDWHAPCDGGDLLYLRYLLRIYMVHAIYRLHLALVPNAIASKISGEKATLCCERTC